VHCNKFWRRMSASGQKRTFRRVQPMSALPPKADISRRELDVRFVPKADIGRKEHQIGPVIGSPVRRQPLSAGAVGAPDIEYV
jgi:hypothetical protein